MAALKAFLFPILLIATMVASAGCFFAGFKKWRDRLTGLAMCLVTAPIGYGAAWAMDRPKGWDFWVGGAAMAAGIWAAILIIRLLLDRLD